MSRRYHVSDVSSPASGLLGDTASTNAVGGERAVPVRPRLTGLRVVAVVHQRRDELLVRAGDEVHAVAQLGDVAQHLDAAVRLRDDVHAGVLLLERRRDLVERHDEAPGVHQLDLPLVGAAAAGQGGEAEEDGERDRDPGRGHARPRRAAQRPPHRRLLLPHPHDDACDTPRHLSVAQAGTDEPQGEVLVGELSAVHLGRQHDAALAGDVAGVDGDDLAGVRLYLDVVALLRELGVVGPRVVLLPVVDHAGDQIERDALPAPALSVDPAGAVAAGRGAVDVGGAVDLAGHRALQLHLPGRGRLGHADALEPLDGPVPLGDLRGRVLGDGELERPVVLGDGLALVRVGDEDGQLAVGGLLLPRGGVEGREPVPGDLPVRERHAVPVLGHDGDAVGLGDAADEVGELGERHAGVLRRRRDHAGAALDAGVPFVGRQRLELRHAERPGGFVAPDGQHHRPRIHRRRRGLAAGAAAAGGDGGGQAERGRDGQHGQAVPAPAAP